MEKINTKELLKFFASKIYLMIIFVVTFIIIGYVYFAHIQTPMYHSSRTVILVSEQKENTTTNDINMNHQLVTTYSEIIKNSSVLTEVIDKLNLNMSSNELASKISVSAVNNTEIIKIEVSDENNQEAYEIVNAVTEVFIKKVDEVFSLKNIEVLSKATIENEPYNISLPKQLTISALAGLFLSTIVIFLIFYFDTTIKSAEDIEKIGLTVLGKVSKVGGKNDK